MILRRRQVTIAPDVATYIKIIAPLYPNFATLWASVLWHLQHRADQLGEPLAGSSRVATVKLSQKLPVATLVFKLADETVHVTDCEFKFGT